MGLDKERKEVVKKMLCSCENCADSENYYQDLRNIGNKLSYKENFKEILEFCSALGNEDRLKIIEILLEKDRCVCELEPILDKSQPSISHHLRQLEKVNLIRGWKKGKYTYYGILKDELKKYLNLMTKEFKPKGA